MRESLHCLLGELGLPLGALRVALVHSSRASEEGLESNERLEFLGDAVLGLTVADILYRSFPDRDEGELSRIRGVAVSRPVLAELAQRLSLGDHLLLGKGEEESGGRNRPSILAAALEAVFGVVFLELGYAEALALTKRLLGPQIQRLAEERSRDYKTLLQELGQQRFGTPPSYETVKSEGPAHEPVFTVAAELGGVKVLGRGRSKKEAEGAAAKRLYLHLTEQETQG